MGREQGLGNEISILFHFTRSNRELEGESNALADETGIRFHRRPLSPDRIFAAIHEKYAQSHWTSGSSPNSIGTLPPAVVVG